MSSAQVPDISLTDYVAISSMVDDIRGREQQISDIMNSSVVEKILVERLSEQYRRNGLTVDEGVINRGVERYYKDRFKFKAYKLSGVNKLLSTLFLHRTAALMMTGVIGASSVSAPLINDAVISYVDHQKALVIAERDAKHQEEISAKFAELKRIDKSANAWIEKIERKIRSVELRRQHVRSLSSGSHNLASVHDEVDAHVNADISTVREDLRKSKLTLDQIKKTDISKYGESVAKTQSIYNLFVSDMEKLERSREMLSSFKSVVVEFEGLSSMKRRIEAMNLSDRDKAIFDGYLNPLIDGINLISFDWFNQTSKVDQKINLMNKSAMVVKDLVDYAASPLILYISNRGSSGYENGGRYFLNIYAYDYFNQDSKIQYGFNADGSPKYYSALSIEVSSDLFYKIKQDKEDDDYVDENVIGTKPANSLAVQFRNGVSNPLVID